MFFLKPSYGASWRVFLLVGDDIGNQDVHQTLKDTCMWGGHDKTETIDGAEYFGYEFNTLKKACDMIQAAVEKFNWNKGSA